MQLCNVIEDLCSDRHLAGAYAGIKVQFGSRAARNRALSLDGDKPQLSFLSSCFTPKSLSVHLHWLISQLTKIKWYGVSSEQNCAIIFYSDNTPQTLRFLSLATNYIGKGLVILQFLLLEWVLFPRSLSERRFWD